MQLRLADIVIDQQYQIRRGPLDEATVEQYREVLDQMPPVDVVSREERWVLSDGFHRVEAARREGREEIEATVVDDDPILNSLRKNRKHGRPLTREDRHAAVPYLYELGGEWASYGHTQRIANEVGLAQVTVSHILLTIRRSKEVSTCTNLPHSVLKQLGRVPDIDTRQALVDRAVEDNWSSVEAEKAVGLINSQETHQAVKDGIRDGIIRPPGHTARATFADVREQAMPAIEAVLERRAEYESQPKYLFLRWLGNGFGYCATPTDDLFAGITPTERIEMIEKTDALIRGLTHLRAALYARSNRLEVVS